MSDLRKALITARKNAGLTQQELAHQAGIGLATWHNFEAGKGNPALETLESVVKVLGLRLALHRPLVEWNLLIDLGVPLVRSSDGAKVRPDRALLLSTLNQGLDVPAKENAKTREMAAIASFLAAVKDHYPSLWRRVSNPELRKWIDGPGAKLVSPKLRRIAIQKIATYL